MKWLIKILILILLTISIGFIIFSMFLAKIFLKEGENEWDILKQN